MDVKFEFDSEFTNNIYHASKKTRSSLRPLYDKVRTVTDQISEEAKRSLLVHWTEAEAETKAVDSKTHGSGKRSFQVAKAKAFAFKSAYNTIRPMMGVDTEIYGRVVIQRTGSGTLEFGGPDPKAEIGIGTGEYLVHPAYAFLRRAMDKGAV